MRSITIEEYIPGADIAAAAGISATKDVPYMGCGLGKGLLHTLSCLYE